jgi:NAD(P)-dependent dehydrogenase (short-subunit alcohol dehydrogenase family)
MGDALYRPRIDLSGQVALVTGGGRGLGRAFALALSKAGARVAVTARTADDLAVTVEGVEGAGGRALGLPVDVAVPEAVTHLVRTVESHLGPVDILVNNAGVVGPVGDDWESDPEDWWRTFEINMRGSYLCARAVLQEMIRRKRGRIDNVSSGAAFNPLPQMGVYCATKAALTQWTKCLAAETEGRGIAVFAFGPGVVRTSITDYLTASPDVPEAVGKRFRALLDQKRDTPIERCAEMLLFLVSGRADALTGRFIRAQDNEDELVRRAEEIRRDDLHVVTLRV